ncbi:MAG: hypothetical protein OEZ13_09610 [Spirochaetia bacterium]|nr:hypothetical protein [Spirochaetia bacterium]
MTRLSPLKSLLLIGFFFIILTGPFDPKFNLASQPINDFQNVEKKSAAMWQGILPGKAFDFYLIDDFEEKIHWSIQKRSAHEITAKFIEKEPFFLQSKNPVKREKALMFMLDRQYANRSAKASGRNALKDPKYSYEILFHFQNPGKDLLILNLPTANNLKKTIQGIPRAIALWINNDKPVKHTLYALFSNSNGVFLPVKISTLDFNGWQRFEINLPWSLAAKNPKKAHLYDFTFHGLKLKSSSKEQSGFYRFIIDQIIILVDRSQEHYPGAQIKDSWK